MRIEAYKATTSDWYPSFKLNGRDDRLLVRVLCMSLFATQQYRVAVWGADDYGYERDYDSEQEALKVFDIIIVQQTVEPKFLIDILGFYHV